MNSSLRTSVFLVLFSVLLISGCATQKPSLYRWGEYEQLVYEMYAKPGKAEPGVQVAKLAEDVERTLAEDRRVPPGVHAHLGYMYYIQGNVGAAMNEFASEKALFPESGVFIDGILKRLQANKQ